MCVKCFVLQKLGTLLHNKVLGSTLQCSHRYINRQTIISRHGEQLIIFVGFLYLDILSKFRTKWYVSYICATNS